MDLIEFYQQLLQQGVVLLWFNLAVLGLLGVGIGFLVWYETSEESIPDNLIYSLLIFGLLISLLAPPGYADLTAAVFGGLLAGIMFLWVRLAMMMVKGSSTIGFSEVKFAAVAGVWLGWDDVAGFLLLSVLIGAVAFAGLTLAKRAAGARSIGEFPFSPVLGASLLILLAVNAFMGDLGLLMAPAV